MTSVRVWDGTKWNSNVQFNTNTPLLPRWEQWHPPQTSSGTGPFQVRIERAWMVRTVDGGIEHDWHFNTDIMGWNTSYTGTPTWNSGAVLVPQPASSITTYPNSDYFYSPYFNPGRYTGHITVKLNSCTGPLPTFKGNMYYSGLKSNTVTHTFTSIGQTVTLDWPAETVDGLVCNLQTYVQAVTDYTPLSEVTSVNIWNGSTWLTQNAY